MSDVHREARLEDIIEATLLENGWLQGRHEDFDRQRALRTADLPEFLRTAHPDTWAALEKQHGAGLEELLLDTLEKNLDKRGTLDVLRHGFKLHGKKVPCAAFRPASGRNPEQAARYAANRLVVTRQARFLADSEDSVDLLFTLNGLPVATVELKTRLTNQDVGHAKAQYRSREYRKAKLFRFKERALVHFAVDQDEAEMTTRLRGRETYFLPFNLGRDEGKGNPEHPSGHRTAYLWEEVWQRDSLLDILQRFMHLEVTESTVDGKKKISEKLIFPRYHQLRAVRRLEAKAKDEGPGHDYLIQHSAGSGKTNSIAWLAHRLSSLHDDEDRKIFHSVVVVTDRLVLDAQLQDAIYQFEHATGVVECIDKSSQQLADALKGGTAIIVTTLQKFPFVAEKIEGLPERSYAVIVDEAHSSQTGESARRLKELLGGAVAKQAQEAAEAEGAGEELEADEEDYLNAYVLSRGKQPNLSFFAFTATPKARTLQVFGRPGKEGKPQPFDLYSMRQAIEENFILDVLASYTTYRTAFRLAKAVADDPELPERRARAALARFASLHPHNLAQKAEVIVEHFRESVAHRIGGRAKAMVVAASRLSAVRYARAFRAYLKERGYTDVGVLVAFSGTVRDPDDGREYTEPGMNSDTARYRGLREFTSEKELPARFKGPEWQVLLVAEKYQTGFDQPFLYAMYLDRRLAGVKAVQTLSRLNRTCPGKDGTFVLDFVNEPDEIRRAFQPYYEVTALDEPAEPQQLYDLQHDLDASLVWQASEIESFSQVFYKPPEKQRPADQAELERHLNPAVDRFHALDEEAREAFRGKLGAFVRLYAFLSQVMGFPDTDLEKRYTYGRFLMRKVRRRDDAAPLNLDHDVELKYYRLSKTSEGGIALVQGETGLLSGPTEVGTAAPDQKKAPLSQIIDLLNDRFGLDLTAADGLVFEQGILQARADEEVVQRAEANDFDNFALFMGGRLLDIMIDRMGQNEEIVTKFLNDKRFQDLASREMAKRIYSAIRGLS